MLVLTLCGVKDLVEVSSGNARTLGRGMRVYFLEECGLQWQHVVIPRKSGGAFPAHVWVLR